MSLTEQGKIREMSQELTSLIMSKISLAQFAPCWEPRDTELWSEAREERAYMCVKQTVVLMNHRERQSEME